MSMFKTKNKTTEHLRKRWTSRHREAHENLFHNHLRKMAAGSLGGLMLLATPGMSFSQTNLEGNNQVNVQGDTNGNILLSRELQEKLPSEVRPLSDTEEADIASVLSTRFGFKVAPAIDNKRLNRSFGMIGGEQHLYRYPGDVVEAHARDAQDWAMYGSSGIAPGLGAWGYFSSSKAAFDKEAEERERWYIAVPTFLSPGFSERVGEYRDFYKYRKMLLVNPKTGQAVVADIGDAGPAEWTGKHLGGSPEVMHELGLATGPRKGAVLYYFIEDGQDIPLGPIKLNSAEFN